MLYCLTSMTDPSRQKAARARFLQATPSEFYMGRALRLNLCLVYSGHPGG